MTPESDKLRELFLAVLKLPASERDAFLRAECSGADARRQQVEMLVRAHEELGTVAPPANPTNELREPMGRSGDMLAGRYKLLEPIGEGGMGTVWMAQQTEPVKRVVAIKLIKAGMDSKQVIARFEAERQALALMDHPNIAKIFDGGLSQAHGRQSVDVGRPYFVMELVKGIPITKFCDEHRLTPRQRLELFVPVCHAIQHAHQKGVIHRDIKPSNVLVALYDGRPVPKVIDFGVAKAAGTALTEKTLVTGFGNIVGTLEYMSPEQAEVNQLDIDTRSDIYSLGVLLYELLTGSPPFAAKDLEKAGLLEMLRVIREQEPSKPSTKLSTAKGLPSLAAQRGTEPAKLTRLVRGELDWIVMKALEKDRNRRYETANGFAMDVQRYLADEAVQACPPSATYRLRKFVRRHRRAFVVLTALATMLLVAMLSIGVSAVRVWREQKRTQEANQRLRENLALALQALDEIYLKVAEDRLPRDPARKHEHLDLLKRTLNFYEQFARQNNTDPQVRKAQARAYERAGAIRVLLDQMPEAEADLGRAIDLNEALRAELPGDRDVRFSLATAHVDLALLQYRGGRHVDAVRNLDAGQRLLDDLVAEEPREPGYRHDLAQTWNNRGTLLLLERRLSEAQVAYERAAELWDELVRERPDNLMFRAGQGGALINLGEVLKNLGRLPEAETVLRRALAHYERMIDQDPTGAEWRKQQGVLYCNLAHLLRQMGRDEDAVKAAGEAIAIQQRLVADFGTVADYRGALALSHLNRATAFGEIGRVADAEKDYRESLKHLEPLVKSFPDVAGHRRDQALNYLGLSHVQRLAQRRPEAEQLLQQAIAIQEELKAKHPSVPEYQFDLAKARHMLGDLLAEMNRPKEADAMMLQGQALVEAVAKGWPEVPEYRASLARSLVHRGRVLRVSRRSDEAWDLERRAIDIWEKLVIESPHVLQNRVDLAENVHEQARLLRHAKRFDEAEKQSVRAQELWERLVADYPTVARYRMYLGGHLNNWGQLSWDRGDLKKASDRFEQAVIHQEAARKLDPNSAQVRAFLCNHHNNLTEVLTLRGLHAEAAKAAENSPRIISDEDQCLRAAVMLLKCVRLAGKDAAAPAADRAAIVRGYVGRMRGFLEQAERHSKTPAAAKQMTWTLFYNTICAYAQLAGDDGSDSKQKARYGAQAVQMLQQAARSGRKDEVLKALKTDTDLDPLRTRDDFKKLFAELEKRQ